jgi:hypothetical protein
MNRPARRTTMNRLRAVGYSVFGEPPPKNAPRSELLRWVRRFYVRPLPLMLVVYVMLIVWASGTWVFIALAVGTLIWLQGLLSVSRHIGREQRRERL